MTTLFIQLPDDMAERLKTIAHHRSMSLNKLMFELSTQVLVEEDANPAMVSV
jgi:predicted transcriptional regulator